MPLLIFNVAINYKPQIKPMNKLLFLKHILFALLCVFAMATAAANDTSVPTVDLSNCAERLKIDKDPTLMTSIKTEWEIDLCSITDNDYSNDPYENGHNLFYHNGKLYTYLHRYGSKVNPVMRQFDANDPNSIIQKEIPLNELDELWLNNSLLKHTITVDDNGKFLFIFGLNNENSQLALFSYDFDNNQIERLGQTSFSEEITLKFNFNNSSLDYCKGMLSGSLDGDFSFKSNVLIQHYNKDQFGIPLFIDKKDRLLSASRKNFQIYNFGKEFNQDKVVDFCEVNDTFMVVSHVLPEAFKATKDVDRISLFKNEAVEFSQINYSFIENWPDNELAPAISYNNTNKGNCFGIYTIKHDNHTFLIYAKSYLNEVIYNVVLWDSASSFENMQLLAQIKVNGKISEKVSVYERGIRQMVVQEPRNQVVPESRYATKDYYVENVFYTYAPGASLAKHHIITEEDKIYTALAEVEAVGNSLKLEGKTLQTAGDETISFYNACGSKVAEYAPAKEVSLENLPTGFYLIKCGKETVKALL